MNVEPHAYAEAAEGSARLLRATVAMALRNGITLPGMSAGHTIALAKNLGVIAREPESRKPVTARPAAAPKSSLLSVPSRVRNYVLHASGSRGVASAEIFSESRSTQAIAARHEVMRRLHADGDSSAQIGRWLNRDHTSVLHVLGKGLAG